MITRKHSLSGENSHFAKLRVPALLAAAVFCVFFLFSCGIIIPPRDHETETEAETTAAGQNEETTAPEEVETGKTAADYLADCCATARPDDGRLIIAAANDSHLMPQSNEKSRDVLRAERNAALKEALGCDVVVIEYDIDKLYRELTASRFSGDDNYIADLIALPREDLGRFAMTGLLSNLRQIPFWHMDEPYYDTAAMEKTAVNDAIYGAFGAATDAPDAVYAVFCNETLLAPGDADAIMAAAAGGTWNTELLLHTAENAAASAGIGLGVPERSASFFADLTLAAEAPAAAQSGFFKAPVYDPDLEAVARAADAASALFSAAGPTVSVCSRDDFLAGRVPLFIDRIDAAEDLTTAGFAWTVYPFPTASGAPGGALACSDAPVFVVPYSVRDAAWSGQALEALFAASYGMQDTYLSDLLQYTVPNLRTFENIRYAAEHATVSFGLMFASGCPALRSTLQDALIGQMLYGASVRSEVVPLRAHYETQFYNAFTAEFRPTSSEW